MTKMDEPPIGTNGERLTCDAVLKKMACCLGDDEEKCELCKSARKKAKEHTRKYSLFSRKMYNKHYG